MSEEPSMKDAIAKQTAIVIALQQRLEGAISRNNAEDSNQFAQATLTATQTWLMLVNAWEEIKPKPSTPYTTQPAATYQKHRKQGP